MDNSEQSSIISRSSSGSISSAAAAATASALSFNQARRAARDSTTNNNNNTNSNSQQPSDSTTSSNSNSNSSSSGNANGGSPKMGSRRIFTPQFKLQVLESYRNDNDCKGNQRATARKYNIHRRQIQKWLQCEPNLRSSVANNNQHQQPGGAGNVASGSAAGTAAAQNAAKQHQFHNMPHPHPHPHSHHHHTHPVHAAAAAAAAVAAAHHHHHHHHHAHHHLLPNGFAHHLSPHMHVPVAVPVALQPLPPVQPLPPQQSCNGSAAAAAVASGGGSAVQSNGTDTNTLAAAQIAAAVAMAAIATTASNAATTNDVPYTHHQQQQQQPQQPHQPHQQVPTPVPMLSGASASSNIPQPPPAPPAPQLQQPHAHAHYAAYQHAYLTAGPAAPPTPAALLHKYHAAEDYMLQPAATPAPMDLSLGSAARRQQRELEQQQQQQDAMPHKPAKCSAAVVDLTYKSTVSCKRKVHTALPLAPHWHVYANGNGQDSSDANGEQPDKITKLEAAASIKSESLDVEDVDVVDVDVDEEHVDVEQEQRKALPSKQIKLFKPYLLDVAEEKQHNAELDLELEAETDSDATAPELPRLNGKKQKKYKKNLKQREDAEEALIYSQHPNCMTPPHSYRDGGAGAGVGSFQSPPIMMQQQHGMQLQTFPGAAGSPQFQGSNSSSGGSSCSSSSCSSRSSKSSTPQTVLSPFSAPALSPTGFCCPKGSPVSGYESSSSTYSDSASNSGYSLNLQLHAVYNDNLMSLMQHQQQQQQQLMAQQQHQQRSTHFQRWLDQEISSQHTALAAAAAGIGLGTSVLAAPAPGSAPVSPLALGLVMPANAPTTTAHAPITLLA